MVGALDVRRVLDLGAESRVAAVGLPGRDVFIFENLRALSYPLGTCVE